MEQQQLYEALCNHFSVAELQELCFKMKINYDDLPGQIRRSKATELILYCERHQRLDELQRLIHQRSTSVSSPLSLSPNQGPHQLQMLAREGLLGAIALLGILISLLELFGFLGNLPYLVSHVSALTLLLLGFIAGYLVLERRSHLANLERSLALLASQTRTGLDEVITLLASGISVREFSYTQEVYEYVVERMQAANKSIDDLTWGSDKRTRTLAAQQAHEKYIATIEKVCSRGQITYREVISFPPPSHVDRAEDILAKNLYGYHLRYYLVDRRSSPPLFSFMIIDSEELIIGFYREPYLPVEREVRLAIKHPDIIRLFQDYYDTIWQGAHVLKEGKEVNLNKLAQIRKQLER